MLFPVSLSYETLNRTLNLIKMGMIMAAFISYFILKVKGTNVHTALALLTMPSTKYFDIILSHIFVLVIVSLL
jgi:hypothetical protein